MDRQESLQRVESTYRRIGRRWAWNLISLISFQGWEPIIRKRVVARLHLHPGNSVLDVACGRGSNLPYLVQAVGTAGRVVGLDYSSTMLAGAEELVRREGWTNVELVRGDAANIDFDSDFDGAVCTLSLSVIPRWQEAMDGMVAAVRPGKRVVVMDGRWGTGLKRLWNPYLRLMSRLTASDLGRDIPGECRRRLNDVREEGISLSTAFLVSGVVPPT